MTDHRIRIGDGASGNFNIGDKNSISNVTITRADTTTAKRDLLDQLAALRTQVAALDAPAAVTRIDDLAEEVSADELDQKGGRKAFDRLKAALAGVASVTGLLAGIEEQVRSLFA